MYPSHSHSHLVSCCIDKNVNQALRIALRVLQRLAFIANTKFNYYYFRVWTQHAALKRMIWHFDNDYIDGDKHKLHK